MILEVKKRAHKRTPYFTVFVSEGNKSIYLSGDSVEELNEKLAKTRNFFGRPMPKVTWPV